MMRELHADEPHPGDEQQLRLDFMIDEFRRARERRRRLDHLGVPVTETEPEPPTSSPADEPKAGVQRAGRR